MKLSDNFTLQEFVTSQKAIELGIDNTPNMMQIAALEFLCDNILEPVRLHFNAPVTIRSGFRSKDLNKAVGGAETSQHLYGEAADIEVKGVRNDDVWRFICTNTNFDQVIAEKLKKDDGSVGWIHVSHKRVGRQRNEALSYLGDGKYVKGLQYV